MIFAYNYGCCVFKHNICGDHPVVLDGMSDSFFPLPPELFVNFTSPPPPRQRLPRTRQSGCTRARRPRNLRRILPRGTRADANPPFFFCFVRGLVRSPGLVYFFDAIRALIKYHFWLIFSISFLFLIPTYL